MFTPDAGRVATLVSRFEGASGAELHAGLGWYEGEAARIHAVVPPGVCPDRAVVAAAVLSPRTKWEQLVNALGPWLRGEIERPPAYGKLVDKAEAVLVGEIAGPDYTTSPKTNSFARALLGDRTAVTIDVWMLRAMGVPEDEPLDLDLYEQLVVDVSAAAALVGVSPRDLQAVVWVTERGVTEL